MYKQQVIKQNFTIKIRFIYFQFRVQFPELALKASFHHHFIKHHFIKVKNYE